MGQFGYWIYAGVRSGLRATGFVKPVRRTLGRSAARLVFRLSARGGTPVVVQGHRMILAPKGEYAAPDMVADRYEPETTRLFQAVLRPGQTVMDIGAHVGYYTLLAARTVGPAGSVYAFEPAPENAALLRRNVELNGYRNVVILNQAVSDRSGDSPLFLNQLDTGSHSLQALRLPASGVPQAVTVPVTTLDVFLEAKGWPRIDVVKMDIEGGEGAALRGMRGFLQRAGNLTFIIEFCPWILRRVGSDPSGFLDELSGYGFEIQMIEATGATPLAGAARGPLIAELLRREGYLNLLCLKRVVGVRSGKAPHEPVAVGSRPAS